MDAEELAKKAMANMFANAGIVRDNPGQNNALAKDFRQRVTSSLSEQEQYAPFLSERIMTIHAWNPQYAGIFFENGQFLITYWRGQDNPWEIAGAQGDHGIDPYELNQSVEALAGQVQMMEPKLFVYVGKDGEDTAAV